MDRGRPEGDRPAGRIPNGASEAGMDAHCFPKPVPARGGSRGGRPLRGLQPGRIDAGHGRSGRDRAVLGPSRRGRAKPPGSACRDCQRHLFQPGRPVIGVWREGQDNPGLASGFRKAGVVPDGTSGRLVRIYPPPRIRCRQSRAAVLFAWRSPAAVRSRKLMFAKRHAFETSVGSNMWGRA